MEVIMANANVGQHDEASQWHKPLSLYKCLVVTKTAIHRSAAQHYLTSQNNQP